MGKPNLASSKDQGISPTGHQATEPHGTVRHVGSPTVRSLSFGCAAPSPSGGGWDLDHYHPPSLPRPVFDFPCGTSGGD